MKASVYKELQEALRQQNDNVLETVRRSYPWIEFDTLVAIYSQECSRHVRLQHHKFRTRQRIQEYITRYISGEDVMEISKSFELPPCTLARFLLEHMVGLQKNQVSTCLKDPLTYLPPSPIMVEVPSEASKDNSPLVEVSRDRLCTDVYRCIDNDLVSSPCVAVIRRVTGLEYEVLLGEKLQDLGIAFQSEDALRTAGFSKTPDVKLEVPIGVRGRMVCWIDSKASFGDDCSHKSQAGDQFQSYVNRFGPGMVIYWFGFIDEFNDHSDVLLMDHFPDKSEVYCLPRLPLPSRT